MSRGHALQEKTAKTKPRKVTRVSILKLGTSSWTGRHDGEVMRWSGPEEAAATGLRGLNAGRAGGGGQGAGSLHGFCLSPCRFHEQAFSGVPSRAPAHPCPAPHHVPHQDAPQLPPNPTWSPCTTATKSAFLSCFNSVQTHVTLLGFKHAAGCHPISRNQSRPRFGGSWTS